MFELLRKVKGKVAPLPVEVHQSAAKKQHNSRYQRLLRATQFGPLTFFVLYASWQGQDDFARWLRAFEYSALLVLAQFWFCRHQRPVNKLMVSANLYLLFGAAASVLDGYQLQLLLDQWRAQALFVLIATINLCCTLSHSAGCLSSYPIRRWQGRWASLSLTMASLLAILPSTLSGASLLYVAFVPLLVLSLLEKWLSYRVSRPSLVSRRH